LINQLRACDEIKAIDIVDAYLAHNNIPIVGRRSVGDITRRLLNHVADLDSRSLDKNIVSTIKAYLAINDSPHQALEKIRAVASAADVDLSIALGAFERRLELFEQRKINLDKAVFSAEFGRNLEYYTGFVFQLEMPGQGIAGQLAGGGRYDNLLSGLGAPTPVPAVGCAIHLDRLLNCASGLEVS